MEPLIYSRRDAADVLGVSITTLDRLIHRTDHPIPTIKLSPRRIVIPGAALERWIAEENDSARAV